MCCDFRLCCEGNEQTALLVFGIAGRSDVSLKAKPRGGVASTYEQSELVTRDQFLSPQQAYKSAGLWSVFLYRFCEVRVRIQINAIHKSRISTVLDFWKHTLEINDSQIQQPYFINIKPKKIYENYDLYYGIARLKVVKSSNLAYKMLEYIGTIKAGVA